MFIRTVCNDILKSKSTSLITVVFVAAAALLVTLGTVLVVNLAGSIDMLMLKAETPHFMQMHSGNIDSNKLEEFVKNSNYIEKFQISEFLNLDGSQIIMNGISLADSVQDNGFTAQNELFDFLLDQDGKVIRVSDGEVFIPICYFQDGTAKPGDKLFVSGKEFNIAGFLRDSQMNSQLASSKRFLISKNDFEDIRELGNIEYLIEFRLKTLDDLRSFTNAYTSAGLDANGPTITYPLFRMINAISDGFLISVILLISALVVAIAFMCIRFTLLAKIEDDYREIGVLKAIGLRVSEIKKIYIAKYTLIAGLGSILGFSLSFLFRGVLLENIRLYMGESDKSSLSVILGLVGVGFVFLAIIIYVNGILNIFRKISPAEAIRFGTSQEKHGGGKFFSISRFQGLHPNLFLGVKDVLSRKKIYLTMLFVFIIAAFIMIIPLNLSHTISSKDFITYMGLGHSDLRIDLQQTEQISQKANEIAETLKNDPSVKKFTVLTTRTFVVRLQDGTEERLKVELGDHAVFPLNYSEGRAPEAEDEIALSILLAKDLQKNAGDTLQLEIGGQLQDLRVSGLYSDITNGGKTAKAVFQDNSSDIMWSVICLEFYDQSFIAAKTVEYVEKFDFAKVSGIDSYILQTFGGTIRSIQIASYAAIGIAVLVSMLVTLLFMKMLIVKDGYSISVMKAFGFTNKDIKKQYIVRSGFVLLTGILLGTLLANTLGEVLSGAVLLMFGASSFQFVINPFSAYLLCPVILILSVLSATYVGTLKAGQISIHEFIKE